MQLRAVFLVPLLIVTTGCATVSRPLPEQWTSVPRATPIRAVSLALDGRVSHSAETAGPRTADGAIRVVSDPAGARIANGLKLITGAFPAIESLDHSPERGEVAFSAERDGDFDVALVADDGSAMNWMPDDPADEVNVQWAPKGNKISYVIRAAGGDAVRTLHIPTSFQFAVPFENGTIHALAWDAEGAKYAVAYSTPDASDRVEVLAYDGTPRSIAVPPEQTLPVDVERFAAGAVILRPRDLAYSERLPVVVWQEPTFAWSDARAALMRDARVAVIVTTKAPTHDLWEKVAATPWLDASRTYLVGNEGDGREGTVVIAADPAQPAGQYSRSGNRVSVAPAVVQSVAARFIAGDLERTAAADGSRR